MKQFLRRVAGLGICLSLLSELAVFAQPAAPKPVLPQNWFALDQKTDGYYGISLAQAYQFLKGKKSKTVVVGVIDSGIDTLQKDLRPVLWTNTKEKPGNGKDDDGNGFIDDVHGWNFIGGANGQCDCKETSEEVREYERLKGKYASITNPPATPDSAFAYWLLVKRLRDSTVNKAETELKQLTPIMSAMVETSAIIKRALKLRADQGFKLADLKKLNAANDTLNDVKLLWTTMLSAADPSATSTKMLKDYSDYMAKLNNDVNPDLEVRKRTVGDNPDVLKDKPYGNNQVKSEQSFHGTMVSGFIAAVRNNGYGINGVADNVKILPVVASPDGDEYDKDVANAIYYAVDNGARIINMSFGKKLSPHKAWVDAAFKYAAKHDVLLVLAAGNDNLDIDNTPEYPNDTFLDGSATDADNVIFVGASGPKKGENLAAEFSNYGKKNVDVFAPGTQVTSVALNGDTETEDGTSFSSPITAGVAALVAEYYPDLSARQLKQVILQSAKPLNGLMVNKPGTQDKVDFTTLSKTGGIVNAYEALQVASKMKGERTAAK
ncbi:S8 family serine peptidase [Mucilaginibacter sp. RS28]|uniref:S8 family serine peptidase n=1 Tax=Mucilaginibacter straminoryzae TaxID=2932774 RepID=A0A9X1X3P2_9SPHI|nr:S8 family serine peptidase [Mucilaginibacter straminoryzae]MCJ8210579.1 S8 family serine peptidase [Mucilaginibacter straminoryzae]